MTLDFFIVAFSLCAAAVLGWALLTVRRFEREHRRFARKLADSEARSLAITEGMADGVITTEPDGTIVEANRAAREMFRFEGDEMRGLNVTHLVPERHRGYFEGMIAELASRQDHFREPNREARGLRKDGSEFPVRVSFSDIVVGRKRLFNGIIRDRTERQRIIVELRKRESELRQLTDAVPALIAYIDADERFQFHNKAYLEYFNLQPEQVDGHTIREIFGDAVYADVEPHVRTVLSGYPTRYERRQQDRYGHWRDFAAHYFPRFHAEHDEDEETVIGFFALVTDITVLKRVDRMKSEFVSTVSHELRTPLTSIRGSLGLLAGGVAGKLPDEARGLVEIAYNNCERLIRLINDILDSEKIESGKMNFELKVVALRPLLESAIESNEGYAAHHGVHLVLYGPETPVYVNADGDRLTQVVTNLLSNAVKYSPTGAQVDLSFMEGDGRVRIDVRDRGPGIPEEFHSRIFQKFSQADSSDSRLKGGTGLGLSISRAIVERLGGTIGFNSEPGAGTTFYFELPAHRVAPVAPAAARPGRERVIVVEDDIDIARLIAMMLERAGYATDIARDAPAARLLLASGPCAAMTVDLALPGENGISLIRSLRADEATRELPVLVVSARAEEGRVQLNDETLPVHDWLEKPIDENRLVLGIRNAVARTGDTRARILHVEDDPDVRSIAAAIAEDFASFEFAASIAEARTMLSRGRFDLVLLDLGLPDGSGWELLADLEALQPSPPLVVFSASDQVETDRAAAFLVKARTTNEVLVDTVKGVLARAAAPVK